MVTRRIQTAILGIAMAIGVPVFCLAQASQTKADTYTWNGELVSLDTTAKTMTVKSRVGRKIDENPSAGRARFDGDA
jgi:hypothetical protein